MISEQKPVNRYISKIFQHNIFMLSYFTSYMLFGFVLMPCIYTKIFKGAYLSDHRNAIYLSNAFLSYNSGFGTLSVFRV